MVTTAPLQGLAEEHLQLLTPPRMLAKEYNTGGVYPAAQGRGDANEPPERASEVWSGKRDLNPRPSPWQGDALPLSYSRSERMEEECRILLTKSETVKQREW